MASLGYWTPFVSEAEILQWYRLPRSMQTELTSYRPDGREMRALHYRDYKKLHEKTVMYVRNSVAAFHPPYHNDQFHFAVVEANGLAAADEYARGRPELMPDFVRQVFGLTLRAHDAHHCASTFRSDAPRGMFKPELGTNVSSEWVTAADFNSFMRREGLHLPARLFQTSVIWSSTYGGNTPKGQALRLPNPQPRTIWGAIMRAADVCPPPQIDRWLHGSIAIGYGEVPAAPQPQTIVGYVDAQLGFMDYVISCFDEVDRLGGAPITTRLRWRTRVTNTRKYLMLIRSGDQRAVKQLRNEAAKYNTTLL